MPPPTTIRPAPPSAFHQQLDPRFSTGSLDRHISSSLAVQAPRSRRFSSGSSSSEREFFGSSPRASWSPSTPATSIASSAPSYRGRPRASSLSHHQNLARPLLINNDSHSRRGHSPIYVRDYSPNRSNSRTVVQPASSIKSGRRSRRDSIARSEGGSTAYSTTIYDGNSPPRSYHGGYRESSRHRESSSNFDFPRRGRTKFPPRLVAREAVEEMDYPYDVEENGSIVVMKALGRTQIDELVQMTERIRLSPSIDRSRSRSRARSMSRARSKSRARSMSRNRSRSHARKSVTFYEKTLVHQPAPMGAPFPSEGSISEFSDNAIIHHASPTERHHHHQQHQQQHHHRHHQQQYQIFDKNGQQIAMIPAENIIVQPVSPRHSQELVTTTTTVPTQQLVSTTRIEPLQPPGPSTPNLTSAKKIELTPHSLLHRSSGKKIAEAEEKAMKAHHAAALKEERAARTGRLEDQKEAMRARMRADELMLRVEEVEVRERRKMMERGKGGKVKGVVRVGKNRRGETVIIQS